MKKTADELWYRPFSVFSTQCEKTKKLLSLEEKNFVKPNTHVIQVYVWLVISRNFWQKIVEVNY